MPKTTTPEIPTSVLNLMWQVAGTLDYIAEMLQDIERGNLPTTFDLAGAIDDATELSIDLAAILPDDPDQLDLFAA